MVRSYVVSLYTRTINRDWIYVCGFHIMRHEFRSGAFMFQNDFPPFPLHNKPWNEAYSVKVLGARPSLTLDAQFYFAPIMTWNILLITLTNCIRVTALLKKWLAGTLFTTSKVAPLLSRTSTNRYYKSPLYFAGLRCPQYAFKQCYLHIKN
jgi:hypothetical protein